MEKRKPGAALRRPAAARRARPGARQPARRPAPRRAARRARPEAPQGDAARAQAPPGRRRGRRSFTSRTTRKRRSRCPTASRSWTSASSSRWPSRASSTSARRPRSWPASSASRTCSTLRVDAHARAASRCMDLGEGERLVAPADRAGARRAPDHGAPGEDQARAAGRRPGVARRRHRRRRRLPRLDDAVIVDLRTGEQLVVHRLNDEVRARPTAGRGPRDLHWAAEHSFVIEEAREEEAAPQVPPRGSAGTGVGRRPRAVRGRGFWMDREQHAAQSTRLRRAHGRREPQRAARGVRWRRARRRRRQPRRQPSERRPRAEPSEPAARGRARRAGRPPASPTFDPATEPEGPLEVFDWAGLRGHGAAGCWRRLHRRRVHTAVEPAQVHVPRERPAGAGEGRRRLQTDVIHPCIAYWPDCQAAGLIQPFDTALLPGFEGSPRTSGAAASRTTALHLPRPVRLRLLVARLPRGQGPDHARGGVAGTSSSTSATRAARDLLRRRHDHQGRRRSSTPASRRPEQDDAGADRGRQGDDDPGQAADPDLLERATGRHQGLDGRQRWATVHVARRLPPDPHESSPASTSCTCSPRRAGWPGYAASCCMDSERPGRSRTRWRSEHAGRRRLR